MFKVSDEFRGEAVTQLALDLIVAGDNLFFLNLSTLPQHKSRAATATIRDNT